jgi:hypothetical protein
MLLKWLRVYACMGGLALAACSDLSHKLPASRVPPPTDIDGWVLWARPELVLMLVQYGGYHVAMQCKPSTLAMNVRNLEPAQAFPQPPMTLVVNDFKWTGSPIAEMDGDAPLLTANAYLFRDNLPYQGLIDGLRNNKRIRLAFNGVDRELPTIPADVGKAFGDDCEKTLLR